MSKRIQYRAPSAAQIILFSQREFAQIAGADRERAQDFARMLHTTMAAYVVTLNKASSTDLAEEKESPDSRG